MFKKLLLFLLPLCCAHAQFFTATKVTALSSSAEAITIQQPNSGSRSVKFISASICSTAATLNFTLERNGAPATATSLATNGWGPNANIVAPVSSIFAFSSSNVGTSTVIGNYMVPSGGCIALALDQQSFNPGSQSNTNLTIRTASATTTVLIMILWQEL